MNKLPTSFDRLVTNNVIVPPHFERIYINFVAFATSLHELPCNDKSWTKQVPQRDACVLRCPENKIFRTLDIYLNIMLCLRLIKLEYTV